MSERLNILPIVLILAFAGTASGQPVSVHPDSMNLKPAARAMEIFTGGRLQLETRQFFMATEYARRQLKSDHTMAGGIGASFVSAPWHKLGFGASVFAHTEYFGTDITAVDSLTGLQNRYEIGLYDIYRMKTRGLFRAEEVYLYYDDSNIRLRLGQMLLNTPLINAQDGRMRATLTRGAHLRWVPARNWVLQAAVLNGISPRGTTGWFSTGKSVGIYSVGVNIQGQRSGYAGKVSSPAIFMVSANRKLNHHALEIWNYGLPSVFNTLLAKAEGPLLKYLGYGAMVIRQDRLGNGGSDVPANRYFESPFSWSGSFRLEYRMPKSTLRVNVNYTRITAHGRYVFPREWGRDAFYTFLSRERNEGFGDLHAATIGISGKVAKTGPLWSLSGGYFKTPDYRRLPNLNKYAQNSYWQVNAAVRMNPLPKVKGLEIFVLLLTKLQAEDESLPLKLEYNRLNYYHLNVVLNYKISNKNK